VNDDDTSTTTSFELVIIFLHHFSQPLCIVISLFINWWRKNDHIYSSAALKKNINTRSLTMRMRIFQPQCYGAHRCVAHGLCGSRFHSTRRKVRHHET